MSHQNEGAYLPKFVSKQVRSFCKRKQSSHGSPFSPQRFGSGAGGAGGGAVTRRNSYRMAQTLGSMASLSKTRPQQSASIRESLADGYTSMLGSTESVAESLSSDLGDLEEPPEIEETAGACAVIEIVGYSALIESLGRRGNVPSHVVARSLESYFNKIIDIIEECRGDIVKFVGDTIVVVWRCNNDYEPPTSQSVSRIILDECKREMDFHDEEAEEDDYFVGDSHEMLKKHSVVSDCVMTAIVCCMLCNNFLSQSEIWALEDISAEFQGLKFHARSVIGCGSILDAHVGVRGIRMDSILMGGAYNATQECLLDKIQKDEIGVGGGAFMMVIDRLRHAGVAAKIRGKSFVLEQPGAGLSELQGLARVWTERIVYADVQTDYAAMGTLLESYLSDGAAFYLRTLRKQRRGLMLFGGAWTATAVVAIRLKPEVKIIGNIRGMNSSTNVGMGGVDNGASRNSTGGASTSGASNVDTSASQAQIDSVDDALDVSKETQRVLAVVLKCCRKYSMIMHRVVSNPDGTFNVLCALGGIWSGGEREREVVAVKMALATRDALARSQLKTEVHSYFAIATGLAYEGLLVNRHRCEFRVVGDFINAAEELTRRMTTNKAILVDKNMYSTCKTTHISGYFYPLTDTQQLMNMFNGELPQGHFDQVFEVAPRSATFSTSKTFGRMQEATTTASPKDSVAFRDETDKINRVCTAAAYAKNHMTILIEGTQGSGKTSLLNRARISLEKTGFALCMAEAREHESYRQPLYPYTLIVPQLLDLIDLVAEPRNSTGVSTVPVMSTNDASPAGIYKANRPMSAAQVQVPIIKSTNWDSSENLGSGNIKNTSSKTDLNSSGNSSFGPFRMKHQAHHASGTSAFSRNNGLPKLAINPHVKDLSASSAAPLTPAMSNASILLHKSKINFGKFIHKAKKGRVAPSTDGSGSDGDKNYLGQAGDASDGSKTSGIGGSNLTGRRINLMQFLSLNQTQNSSQGRGGIGQSQQAQSFSQQQSQPQQQQQQQQYSYQKLVDTLRNCLSKAGEDPDATLPLLNAVMLPEIPDTNETKNLAPDGRTFLLANLVVRIVKRITESHRLAIIIDDSQWMDSEDWQITMQIIRRCERALVVLASTTTSDYRSTLLSHVKEMGQTEFIELRGWSTSDTDRFMQSVFSDRAKRISKDVVDSVKSQCEGVPAFIDSMSRFLVDYSFLSCDTGELICNIDTTDFELRLPSTFSSLVLWQYDHIRSKEFQRFLRCAAMIGRNFSLEEVGAIWNEANAVGDAPLAGQSDGFSRQASIQRLAALIKIYDMFDMIEQRTFDDQYMDPNYPFRTWYCFRHSAVREAIYKERLSDSERRARHLKLVRFYERQLTDETETIYIPLICDHHRGAELTDRTSILKRIQYMVMLGTYLCSVPEAFMETREIFNSIVNIVVEYNLADDLGPSIISEVHLRLGAAYSHGLSDQISRLQGLRHLLIAISLVDFSWPRTDTDWWTMVWWQGFMLGWNNIFRIPIKHQRSKVTDKLLSAFGQETFTINKYLDRLERLEPMLDMMSRHLFETDARLRDQIACDLLCLNVAFKLGRHVSKARIRLLTSLALKFWFAGHLRLALLVAERSKMEHSQLSEDEVDPVTFASSTSFLTACGKWSDARRWAIRGMEVCQRVGDLNGWLICSHQRCFMLIYDGRFKDALELEKQRGHESRMNGASFGALWSDAVVAQILLLQGDTLAAMRSRIDMDRHYKLVPPQLRAQFQGIFAQLEFAEGNVDNCLGCVERVIELIPKIHYSNNQVFYGVLLGVLAMYSMIERNSLALIRPRRPARSLTSRSTQRTQRVSISPSVSGSGSTASPLANGPPPASRGRRASLGVLDLHGTLSLSSSQNQAHGAPPSPLPNTPSSPQQQAFGSIARTTSSSTATGSILSPSSSETSSLNLAGMLSTPSLSVDRTRIRRLGMTLISVLQPFQGHALCEPMLLLVRGLIRALDGSTLPNLIDGPTALRDWAHKFDKNPEGDMRFMVGVLAMKSWRVSGEAAEWEGEKKLAESIFMQLGIEGCLKIL
ncbi:hypothetical protein BC831DRAFT_478342 [Entophlyctis helioformis]|nr:hypothetical protein BC831DRAFT_478342 [Entophlyctis helioformis]